MRNYDASETVNSARGWIAAMSWICIFIGLIAIVVGVMIEDFTPCLILFAAGITGFIIRALFIGFEVIVRASEIYIAEHPNKESKTSTEQ